MTLSIGTQWTAFLIFAALSIAGALGMATTMSMFRSGIFLMGSFIGVAGLFILLLADLLALLQVMMYVGGMLVMIVFMVMFSNDPGGSMMAGMEMSPPENFFSRGIPVEEMEDMDMSGMSMTTPVKKYAAVIGLLTVIGLVAVLVLRPAWPVVAQTPSTAAAREIGDLLMGKYMMAFEGAGLLILIGIFGAVLMGRTGKFATRPGRGERVAHDRPPAPIADTPLETKQRPTPKLTETIIPEAHADVN